MKRQKMKNTYFINIFQDLIFRYIIKRNTFCFSNNFLKLNIYYEDLNYENLTEVPEIEVNIKYIISIFHHIALRNNFQNNKLFQRSRGYSSFYIHFRNLIGTINSHYDEFG